MPDQPAPGGDPSYPSGVTVGPDGRVWYTANVAPNGNAGPGDGRAGVIDPASRVLTPAGLDSEIISGFEIVSDGTYLWYVDKFYGSVVRMTTSRARTVYFSPSPNQLRRPEGLAVDQSGRIWVASDNDVISRLTPGGTPQTSTWDHFPTGGQGPSILCDVPRDITLGPDGNLWSTCEVGNRILRTTPTGTHTTFALPSGTVGPRRITVGQDGRLWFTTESNRIGAIDPATTQIEVFTIPGPRPAGGYFKLSGIAAGPGGDVWFVSKNSNEIGRITEDGVITRYPVRSGTSAPTGPTSLVQQGGNLWITAENSRQVIRYTPGSRFTDVGFAHPFYDEVEWLATQAITTGSPPALYKPNSPVTRDAMSAFLYRLAGSPAFSGPGVPSFPDVRTSHPFYDEIEWMSAEGITTGYADGRFRPGSPVNRQSMAAFMYRFADEPPFSAPIDPTFPDVGSGHPFYDEIEWMSAEGITTGNADGTYRPDTAVSRQAMAAFMFRLDAVLT